MWAFDGSEQSLKALDCLSWWPKGSLDLKVLTVLKGPALNELGDAVEFAPDEVAAAQRRFDELKPRLAEMGVAMTAEILSGDAAEVVSAYARGVGANFILAGRRGLNLAQRMLLGSVSSSLLKHASCPVLLVR
ncbi:MAG: universal stress protein [Burkholderiales bacterium]|nr:universal stress protein [Burkholderiales bacterium]MDE1929131.1 universal stress protein [Burkholderiales bacterium]MDE2158913.1 universal stress protein [Burkholderiales bacterium]MDE2502424.1 universal stress protein [Burkholderiales bacterium]